VPRTEQHIYLQKLNWYLSVKNPKKIKLFDPMIGLGEERAIKKTLKSRFWASGAGVGNVGKFEKEFNRFIGSKNCVALNSGTAALHLALSLIDLRNKEVILPSLSFVSTAHAIKYNGGKPIFVDIDPETLCLDPQQVKKFITKNTKAILPVHFGGMPCDLDEMLTISKKNKVFLIEDAAHAAGAKYKGRRIGTHSTAVCFSFHPVKNLAMPTGGAITLNGKDSDRFKKRLKSLRWCGISNRKGPVYDVNDIGWNYYMNEFSAVIGIEQLKKLDKMNAIRKQIAIRYSKEIDVSKKMPYNDSCSYHLFWICVNNRNDFMRNLMREGIETGIHYYPIHKMKYYKISRKLPVTENIMKHIVSLPIHPNLTDPDITKIIRLVNQHTR